MKTWLENIGLQQYEANFKREQIRTSKEMEVLKSFGRNEIEKELKITKKGLMVFCVFYEPCVNKKRSERRMFVVVPNSLYAMLEMKYIVNSHNFDWVCY